MENNVAMPIEKDTDMKRMQTVEAGEKTGKPRRVGTVTVGISMVAFGIMFLLCSLFEVLEYRLVFALWPLILIAFGVELLIYSCYKGKLIYDKGSVWIMILMLFLSAGMAVTDVCFKIAVHYLPNL